MNKTTTMKRHILYITASLSVLLMVFGIGFNARINTTKAVTPVELQPATGAAEYRAEDGVIPSAQAHDGVDHAAGETHATEAAHAAEGEHATEDGHATEETDPGVVGMFGINWKLFIAQLINFGIVVFVLWKWVFKPVTSGLSDRTAKIENSLKEAERITKERETFETWKQGEISTVRTEASAIITAAKQQAEALKAETVKATADEQNRIIEQTQKRLEQEKAAILDSAKAELADIVVQATATILKEKIDPKKDQQLIDEALKSAQS